MFFVDTHVHWTHDKLWPAHAWIEKAQQAQVAYMMTICLSSKDLNRAMELQQSYSSVGIVAALHPADVYGQDDLFWEEVQQYAKTAKLKAVGETGLDLFHQDVPLEEQRRRFILHLELALLCQLPVVVHAREALPLVLEILDQHYLSDRQARRGVIHCFGGGIEEYKEITKRGWCVGIGGCVTFKRSNALRECVRILDPSSYVLETDAPYLSPEPDRRRVNQSGYLPEIAKFVALLRDETVEKVAEDTTKNAIALFDLKEIT
ncbi:TatD family hydrolase [Candidatus Similichlamydia laticola]|uniref:Putative deoxyribonuclease YcfH n=1 Tax=Candidatus Similichlamydia laticola TaxID=2170265 RepID=A0A369KJ07_9BACT|nr:TatD family hydrolase [Candidatus Similichlamydia laticola]RDB31744.1 putative deoxyribonuclease YcfH [Candidatus Similichlamydia laticola]